MTTSPPPTDAQDLQRKVRATWTTALGIVAGLAIIFLAAEVFTWFRSALRNARLNDCHGYTKQIALGLSNYEAVHGRFPPAYTTDANGKPLHSWRTLILPYMEQQKLYDSIDLTKPWDDPANAAACSTPLSFYQCPALPAAIKNAGNLTTYLALVTPDSVLRIGSPIAYDDLEDSSNTLVFVDAPADKAVPWMSPHDADEKVLLEFGRVSDSQHAGKGQQAGAVMMAGFADGHSQLLHRLLDDDARRALITVSADDNAAIPER